MNYEAGNSERSPECTKQQLISIFGPVPMLMGRDFHLIFDTWAFWTPAGSSSEGVD